MFHLNDQIHSIYLRGSLPRALAIDGLSDVDTFALIRKDNTPWKKADWQPILENSLQTTYPFVKEVEIMLSSYHNNFFKANPKLSMILKTQSCCIWGEDIIPSLPKFKPGKAMMLNYRWIEDDVNSFLKKEKYEPIDCKEIMKVMIRTGFELVMERENSYTTDLFPCYESFSKYYPDKKADMLQALHLFLNPATNNSNLKSFVEKLGTWLSQEVQKVIERH